MAESAGGFDSIAVIPVELLRETLRRTMVMGLPVEETERPTFYWQYEVTWANHDAENNPWDWTTAPLTQNIESPVQPVCAFEFFSPLGRQGAFPTEVGDFMPTTLVVTMFEDEFAEVQGSSYCMAGPGNTRYFFRFVRPSIGLGDMTIYQIHMGADAVE